MVATDQVIEVDCMAGCGAVPPTATIPITFLVAHDPVQLGLAASVSRPGSNMTEINVSTPR
jgi:ABC-type uncharacterized transport system substrate-binding protein